MASAEKLAIIIIISMTYNDLLLALLVRVTEHESLTTHRPLVRTAPVFAAQKNLKIFASPSWSWPHALGEREVGGGGGSESAAWPRDGAARELGPGSVRTNQLCQSMGIDLAGLTGRPQSSRASEPTVHARVLTALRLRDSACPREESASFSSCARTRTCPEEPGGGRPNAGVEAVGLARCTWRLLGALVLLGVAIPRFVRDSSVPIWRTWFSWFHSKKKPL